MKILFTGKESNPYSRHTIECLANSNMEKFGVNVANFVNCIMDISVSRESMRSK